MDSISMCSKTLYMSNRCGKQFEVAVSLNQDIIVSFWYPSDPELQNLSQEVGWVSSSLGNRTVAGSNRSDISGASFGMQFFHWWKYDKPVFLYNEEFVWLSLAAIVLIFPASYCTNLYEILVPTLFWIYWSHNTHNSTMASTASPSPANTKNMRKITPWHQWLLNTHARRIAT